MSTGFIDIVTITTDENGVSTEMRIHLNNPDGLIHIKEWAPQIAPPEDLFQASPFEDGRVLAMRKYGNAADDFNLNISGPCVETVDKQAIRDLRDILDLAVAYWTNDWVREPVWFEMMGDNTDTIRYSYIYAWATPAENNPLQNPRSDSPSLVNDFHLLVEHSFWLDALDGACTKLSASQDYYTEDEKYFEPSDSADDATVNRTAGTIALASDLNFGKDATPNTLGSGIRFRSVTIPQGATILNAFLDLRAQASLAGVTCTLQIRGEDADNPATFSTYADYIARPTTTAVVAWSSLPAWVAGTRYISPDIKTVIQEIVSRPGFVSGNSMVVFIEDNGSSNGAYRKADDVDSALPVILNVVWYDGATGTYGFSTATCAPIYFADRHNIAQLTTIFSYDASAGTYSANLLGSALPYFLLPVITAIGDMVYFIINSTMPNSGPFGSLVFDTFDNDPAMTGVWEYWNGAWTAIPAATLADNTVGLTVAGVSAVSLEQPLDWATTTVNFVTGWGIRFRVTARSGPCPRQQNRDVFVINTPYVDISEAELGGDLALLSEIDCYEEWTSRQMNMLIAGLRSLKRGNDFSAYINLGNTQNNAGISVLAGPNSSFVSDPTSETGMACLWNSAGVVWDSALAVTISSPLVRQYSGSFIVYIRARLNAASTEYAFKVKVQMQNQVFYESLIVEPEATDPASNRITIGSIGEIGLIFDAKDLISSITISVWAKVLNIADNAYFHTLIMMPNDEWIGQYSGMSAYTDISNGSHLNIDPITQVKMRNVACGRVDATDLNTFMWDDKSPHLPMLHRKNNQRLWLFHPAGISGVRHTFSGHSGRFAVNSIKKYFIWD